MFVTNTKYEQLVYIVSIMTISNFVDGLNALLEQSKKMNVENCENLGIDPSELENDPSEDNSEEDEFGDSDSASDSASDDNDVNGAIDSDVDMAMSAQGDDTTSQSDKTTVAEGSDEIDTARKYGTRLIDKLNTRRKIHLESIDIDETDTNKQDTIPNTKVIIGSGNPLGEKLKSVGTNEGLLSTVLGVAGSVAGGMLIPGGNTFGGKLASGLGSNLGAQAGAKIGQMLEPEDEQMVSEGIVDDIKDGWEGTKNFFKKNKHLILPTLGTVSGIAYGAKSDSKMASAFPLVGGMLGSIAANSMNESKQSDTSIINGFNDFKSWKTKKYGE
jgi:hypothetical protein